MWHDGKGGGEVSNGTDAKTPSEHCARCAKVTAAFIKAYTKDADFTIDEFMTELRRQLTTGEGAE